MDSVNNNSMETTESGVSSVDNTLTPNSPTLLIDESTSRFSSAIWADKIKEQEVTLAGLGGIGSYVAFLLSRVKPQKIVLYDPDRVENSNRSGQLYAIQDIDSAKVRATASNMRNFSDYHSMYCLDSPYTENSITSNIMICGFDNMKARKLFFESWKHHTMTRHDPSKCLFIDGRLAAEEFQIFCIKGDDIYHMEQYSSKYLFSDEEADETICSYKQTSHCATMIASVMVNLFVNFIANKCNPLVERDLPFMVSYDASTMYFKTLS